MHRLWPRWARWVVALAAGGLAAVWLAWPAPIGVDLVRVTRGPMQVTIEDEGKTQVRHVYTVSAPIAGKVLRISHPASDHAISLHVGDPVEANHTVVATLQPMTPSFLDARSREQLEAELNAADAAIRQGEAEVRRLEAGLAFARTELQRAESLARSQTISAQALDKARLEVATNEAALASTRAQVDLRRSMRASAAARLIDPSSAPALSDGACCVRITAPVTGRVLKIVQESEAVVPAGAPLIHVGDPLDLEIAADLLSTDAVKIEPGAAVRIDGWGGEPLRGRVRRVDPAGFLKVSALGIEEQRVRVLIDFTDPPESWARLGHDYRVIVHVVVWSSDDALTVPIGALFRRGDEWAVFALRDGRAQTTPVRIGRRNNRVAQVEAGLVAGDLVVLHPSDRIRDGTAVAARETR